MTRYAELQTTTNFSFLRGASQPDEMMIAGQALGLEAVGITDRNSLAGVVRAWRPYKRGQITVRPLVGCRLDFIDGTPSLLCYPKDRAAFGRLTKLLTIGQSGAAKGGCDLFWEDFLDQAQGQLTLVVPPATLDDKFERDLARIAGALKGHVWLAASRPYGSRDVHRIEQLAALARAHRAPMVATNDVLYHGPERRMLQDVVTCIRQNCSITEAGLSLEANAERHLKTPAEMARLFQRWPGAVERSVEIAERVEFDLRQLGYEYPDEPVPPGSTAMKHLTKLAWDGAKWRYPKGVPDTVKKTLREELTLIKELKYPNYFLTVHDIVRWARDQKILCQGRGSAANSVVCFCIGVTAVDPTKEDQDLLFARFLSKERDEPPDIDVDFEHERREEVMQYIYRRYGRHRAAIVATVIHYRPRSAIRQVGKALGLTEDITAALAGTVWGSWGSEVPEDQVRQAGLDPDNPDIARAVALATILLGFPRHLSQHVGGYVLTKRRLDETVPIGNAAMKDRTFIMWDKDDIDDIGLMKVDVLALGMLTCIKKAMVLLETHHGATIRADLGGPIEDIADIPQGCPWVYGMLSNADSVGVFQVESRAQMSMLPRLKPKKFYDLVIEVAIVRPGPIQGDMVHPYLRRREGLEPVDFPKPHPDHGPENEVQQVLGKTFGVPLFQEQAMRLAIEAAKFSPEEANSLRRAMATFRNLGDLGVHREKFVGGMTARGYDPDFAARCFKQIEGFGSYGFPESHAISFAILVYVSAWLKCWWPDVFCAAILNSLPMGFYQPAQLVRDALQHGVEVLEPDVLFSDWDCTLEPASDPASRYKAVRLGLRQVKGLKQTEAEKLMAARQDGAATLHDLARRTGLMNRSWELLAEADAFRSLGMDRRAALWAVKGLAPEARAETDAPLLASLPLFEGAHAELPAISLPEHVAEDYRTTSLSLKAHPVGFFRPLLQRLGCTPAGDLKRLKDGARVAVGGLVLIRQRPGTASGIVFITLEDETGPSNIVVWADRFQANRRVVMSSSFLVVHGRLQSESGVIHIVAERFTDLTGRLVDLREEADLPPPSQEIRSRLVKSRDFH
ncbi:MAG: error-prone polymerase [Caulobacter sp.]|nr:error-prone polymerase [Caulobacter sp.]